MMAKTYRFIFSILLVCFAAIGKAQTIDGKLYTPFNNYYQWIGGKFNSNLNIPKVTATTGRDTGGIRYSLADSSMYVWTGSQWRAVGSSLDTTSLSNRINQRVKYTDTAAMLSPYIRTASNGLTKSGQNVKLGGSLNEATNINAKGNDLLIDSLNEIKLEAVNDNSYFILNNSGISNQSGYFVNSNNMGFSELAISADSFNTQNYIQMAATKNTTIRTAFNIYSDSLDIKPYRGQINIDSLASTSDTSTHKPIVYDISTGRMKYKTEWQHTDTATVVKAYVTNAEAVTITKGQVVYIFGASGDRASVKLAKNTSDTFSSKTLGIVRADISAGQAGWITTQGQVSGINLGAYSPGDILWLDSVPGGFTKVRPQAPLHGVFVGVVERANAGNGLIYIKPQNGVELEELHDVKLTSPTNNQVLSYTAATGIWENKTVSASIFPYTAQTTTYTAGADDYVIHCTSGTFSINLPTAVGITGKVYIIKNSGSGLITIDPNGSQTIDGVTTYTMGGAESVQVISTGSNWITL